MEADKQSSMEGGNKNTIFKHFRLFDAFSGKLYPETHSNSAKMDVDLFKSFRGFLILGRCLGLIPCSGVFKHSYTDLNYRFFSFGGLTTLACVVLLFFNNVLIILDSLSKKRNNASEIAEGLKGPIFAFWGLYMYSYFLFRGHLFLKIFKAWTECNLHLTFTRHDKRLRWTIILVSVVMFSSAILENAVLHMEYFVAFDHINGHTVKYGEELNKKAPLWQMYYWRAHKYWNDYVGCHIILAVLAFFNHKFILYGGNYVDVMMTLFSRALYFKFHALYKSADEFLVQPMLLLQKADKYVSTESDREAWIQLAQDHEALCEVMNAMNNFFSPVIFVSYAINIYLFCMQLLTTLTPEFTSHSIVHSIYSPWSFIQVIVRIFILSLSMARINEYAHKIRDIVMRCPVDLYTGPVAKLDKRVNTGSKLGMTGLGCFVVTKPFMLSILNVVFTIEIVLLQGLQSSSTSSTSEGQGKNCPPATNSG